jgi:pimeloyl-ACP methyl ester carboxylesterase
MVRKSLLYKSSQISYYRFGNGPSIAICFHGYGENGQIYGFLEKYAGDAFTFYAIELPHHGDTLWQETTCFTHHDLTDIIDNIVGGNNKNSATISPDLTLVGFSLGGRIALSLYQSIPSRVQKLILMAPDGLKVNFWYWLATQTNAGNGLFALTMRRPGWFFGFLKMLNGLGLVNASIFKFVNYYIGDEQARKLLYARWTVLRKLKPNLKRIKSLVRKYKTPVRVIYGKHDRIILSSVGERFKSGIEDHCEICIIHSGHQVLHEKHAEELVPALLR